MDTRHLRSKGFTLLEAIVVIAILGILGATVAVFILTPMQGYFATANRAVLADAADGALRRIGRDVASALPNSLRSTSAGSNFCFEFLPVAAGGRYRDQTGETGNGDILDFTQADTSFDVLGQLNLGNLPTSLAYNVAIYNLGIAGADAYNADNTAAIANVSTMASASNIKLSPGKLFPLASPANAFSVIQNYSVVYSWSGNTLYRATQPISPAKMSACPTPGAPGNTLSMVALVTNVFGCQFYYLPAVNERDGILSMALTLTLNNDTVTLYDQVMVNNAP